MISVVAIIDMGTNTFHLMIAKKQGAKFQVVHRDREAVKIGKGGINDGRIVPEAVQRAVDTLRRFSEVIKKFKAEKVLAFGTSALRNAVNGKEVCERITSETGIEVKIISGDEEAELIYKGVRAGVPLGKEKSMVVDIGGGSVEFIIASEAQVFWKASLEVGGQRLLELFHKHDPILPQEIDALNIFLLDKLKIVFEKLDQFKPETLVGSSGTFDTLSEIYCHQHGIVYNADDGETPFSFESFYRTYYELIQKNRAERLAMPGMIELRVDMIVVACVMIHLLLRKYSFKDCRVSTFSLKEGVLASLTE